MKDWCIDWEAEHIDDPEYENMTEEEFWLAAEEAYVDYITGMADMLVDQAKYGKIIG